MSFVYVIEGHDLLPSEHFYGTRFDSQKDLGSMRGWACGTILEARLEKIFHFHDHFMRLQDSARFLGIPFWVSPLALERAIKTELRKSGFVDALVCVRVSRGQTDDTVNPNPFFRNRASLSISVFPGQRHTMPIRLVSRSYRREYPAIKHTNYLFAELEYQDFSLNGIHDILYCDPDDRAILECSRKNVGIVFGRQFVLQPAGSILVGITMKIVAKLAASKGFAIARQRTPLEDIYGHAKNIECGLIAMSTTGVVPVEELDGSPVPITDEVRELCGAFNVYRMEYYRSDGVNEIKL